MSKETKLTRDISQIFIPVDNSAAEKLRQTLSKDGVKVKELLEGLVEDPVLILETVLAANSGLASGKPACVSLNSAASELGADRVLSVIQTASDRSPLLKGESSRILSAQKESAKLVAGICSILSGRVSRSLREEAATIGALSFCGEFLAVLLQVSETIGIFARAQTSAEFRTRLASEAGFDCKEITLEYLSGRGAPKELWSALESRPSQSSGNVQLIHQICSAAFEFLVLWQEGTLSQISTIDQLPPKSALRLLKLSDADFKAVVGDSCAYLDSTSSKIKNAADGKATNPHSPSQPARSMASMFLNSESDDQVVEVDIETTVPVIVSSPQTTRLIESIDPPELPEAEEPVDISEAASSIISSLDSCATAEELVELLLDALLSDGPFLRTALLVISPEEKKAKTVAASGIFDSKIATLDVSDPLSPLLKSSIRVESFGSKGAACSPFGSKAFVLAPLYSASPRPVFLYADCGDDVVLSMEARSLFRKVIEAINEKLPGLPGNFPEAFEDLES